jgi:hypothetical protein
MVLFLSIQLYTRAYQLSRKSVEKGEKYLTLYIV